MPSFAFCKELAAGESTAYLMRLKDGGTTEISRLCAIAVVPIGRREPKTERD
jgi:hypothetical protein